MTIVLSVSPPHPLARTTPTKEINDEHNILLNKLNEILSLEVG